MRINFKVTLIVFFIILLSVMLVRYEKRATKRHYCDFRVYYHTAQTFLNKGDIYFRDKEEVTPFKYSPFFAFLSCPLGLFPVKHAAMLFFIINFLSTFGLFYLSRKLFIDKPLDSKSAFFLYFLTALFAGRFILQVWDSGQINIIMYALVVLSLFLFSKGKDILGAIFLSTAILFKYTPALFIPYLILRKKNRAALWTIVFTMLWLIVPAGYVGFEKEFQYLTSWLPSISQTSLDMGSYADFKNQSFYSMFIRFLSPTEYSVNVLSLNFFQAKFLGFLGSLLLYVLAVLPKKNASPEQSKYDLALLFICLPLFNPNAWMINFAALVVPYMVLIYYLMQRGKKDFFVFICVGAAFILTSLMSQDIVGNDLENWATELSCVTVGALFLFMALVKLKFLNNKKI